MSEDKINQETNKKSLDDLLKTLDMLEEVLPLAKTSKFLKFSQDDISRFEECIANYRKLKNCGEPTPRNFCVINGVPPTMENYNKIRNEMFQFAKECTLRIMGGTKALKEEAKSLGVEYPSDEEQNESSGRDSDIDFYDADGKPLPNITQEELKKMTRMKGVLSYCKLCGKKFTYKHCNVCDECLASNSWLGEPFLQRDKESQNSEAPLEN